MQGFPPNHYPLLRLGQRTRESQFGDLWSQLRSLHGIVDPGSTPKLGVLLVNHASALSCQASWDRESPVLESPVELTFPGKGPAHNSGQQSNFDLLMNTQDF